jgi:transposase
MKKEAEQKESLIRLNERCHFQRNLRDEIVKSIETGTPRSVIAYQYGMSRATLYKWMRNHGSKEYHAKQLGTHLTEVEKRSIVRQVEQGVLTPYAARKVYGLSGNVLNKWLKASLTENAELAVYDPFEMKDTPVGQPDLPDPEKDALKKALEEAQLKISALNTLIDVAEDQFKIKIRKKAGARQS